MHVYKELSFVGNKPGLDSLAKNIYTVFPMNWIKPVVFLSSFILFIPYFQFSFLGILDLSDKNRMLTFKK